MISISQVKSDTQIFFQIVVCAPGFELDGNNMCAACNVSYYNPDIGGDCVRCENGTTTERTGANMTSNCGRHRCQNIFYL